MATFQGGSAANKENYKKRNTGQKEMEKVGEKDSLKKL